MTTIKREEDTEDPGGKYKRKNKGRHQGRTLRLPLNCY